MTSAVVFAYHHVGVRCLNVLLAHGVQIKLILTHTDDPAESIWFESVATWAKWHEIPCIAPQNPAYPDVIERIKALSPDFIFSFYYRKMLPASLLSLALRGAYNMHGSLLPKYRGRAPVNWAILNGERETGATLHVMTEKPDAGDILYQFKVPICPDDRAIDVFQKVTVAAEITLDAALPRLIEGTLKPNPQTARRGHYFGGRTAADGLIDWHKGAIAVHNLVRAVSPPYPGAFSYLAGLKWFIWRTRRAGAATQSGLAVYVEGQRLYVDFQEGERLELLEYDYAGIRDALTWQTKFGSGRIALAL